MLKRLLLALITVIAFANFAFAVEVNKADRAALDSVKSIGGKTADAIIAERTKGGEFKDWNDFIHRVKGVGPKNAAKMSGAGLTVNGQPLDKAAPAEAKAKSGEAPKAAQAAAASAKPADTKEVDTKASAKPKKEKEAPKN
jgi:competence protein ComEA